MYELLMLLITGLAGIVVCFIYFKKTMPVTVNTISTRQSNELVAIRALSSALRNNSLSNRFEIIYASRGPYDQSSSRQTIMFYDRSSYILMPYGPRFGPRARGECRDEFYFSEIDEEKIREAAQKNLTIQILRKSNGWKWHQSEPLCS
jgi:hypothetical protein